MSNKRNGATSREEAAHTPKNRPERVRLGQGSKMSVPECYKREGYHQYWFIDRPGDIEAATAAWYEFVKDDSGKKITTPAGNGNLHYLMEIDQKTYDEDMLAQQELITDTTRKAVKVKNHEYSPEGHDAAITRDI